MSAHKKRSTSKTPKKSAIKTPQQSETSYRDKVLAQLMKSHKMDIEEIDAPGAVSGLLENILQESSQQNAR